MAILSGVRQILHLNWTPEGPVPVARPLTIAGRPTPSGMVSDTLDDPPQSKRGDVGGSTGPKIKSVCKSGTRIAAHETGANHQNVTMLSPRNSA